MSLINSTIRAVTAFAPASCGNVAVGFDILGFALESVGDHVTLTRREDNQIVIESIDSADHLPLETHKNTASVVIQKLCQDLKLDVGFTLNIKKGISISSGMGGSAASAVAALVACNAFLSAPLSDYDLVQYALLGEEVASGQPHADNIVPCLFGGLTLIQSLNPLNVIHLPIPDVFCVLVHPHLFVSTKEARGVLKDHVSLPDFIKQSSNLASFIVALYEKNDELMRKSLNDILIEPQRAQFVPGFYEIKKAALQTGALGVSFSGSGPSIFAFAKQKNEAVTISSAIQSVLKDNNIASDCWVTRISKKAAHITQTDRY